MVQMFEISVLFEVLCIYRGDGCAARGIVLFVRSVLTRVHLSPRGGEDATSNTRENHETPFET